MKKEKNSSLIILIVALIILLAIMAVMFINKKGENTTNTVADATKNETNTSTVENKTEDDVNSNNITETGKVITPNKVDLDINSLEDCMFAARFKASDVYQNDDGALVVTMKVMAFESYEATDIATMVKGDAISVNGKKIIVESIERDGNYAIINGGIEKNGCDLKTDEDGTFYEILADDAKRYYSLGEVTIPVDQEFQLEDNSDLNNTGKISYAGDFLIEMENSTREFSENATTVRIENGKIKEITVNYIP